MPSDQREQRSPLGLGPLETAIMQVMWEADDWLMVRDIRGRMDYAPVAYMTVSKVTSVLCEKDLLIRRRDTRAGKPGPAAWWYRAARPMNEHIGELIAKLMDYSPDPEAALAYAMAARQRPRPNSPEQARSHRERAPLRPPMPASPRRKTVQGSPGPDPSRSHDVSGLTAAELERTRRELQASLALVRPGSPACVPILAHLSAIDAELAGRSAGYGASEQLSSLGARTPGGAAPAAGQL